MAETINVKNLNKTYDGKTMILENFSYTFESGKFYAIMGRSGAGKSTLLNIIGTIDSATDGEVLVMGKNVTGLKEKEKAVLRMKNIGFVFQGFYLNPYLNGEENVIVPMRINREIPSTDRKQIAEKLMADFGVENLKSSLPSQMSGGEQQRVCIARALANNPDIILADEPTGNPDSANSHEIMELLKLSNKKYNQTLVVITHDENIALQADRIIEISDGRITRDEVIR